MAAMLPPSQLPALSEEWSFCVGDVTKRGMPLVLVSPGFEQLTGLPKAKLLGRKCGDALGARGLNPPWLHALVRDQVLAVARGAPWSDFLVRNARADGSTFASYVRLALLDSLLPGQAAGGMLALQIDATGMVPGFQRWDRYEECLLDVRAALASGALTPDRDVPRAPAEPWAPCPAWDDWDCLRGLKAKDDDLASVSTASRSGPTEESQSRSGSTQDDSQVPEDPREGLCVVEYRHTQGNFQPHVLLHPSVAACVEPRHLPGGPLVLTTSREAHSKALELAKGLYPRFIVVEAALLGAVGEACSTVRSNRGRKVNEKQRRFYAL